MFCDFCGKKLPDDSLFCPFCGARLTALPPQPDMRPDDTEANAMPAFPEESDSVSEKSMDQIPLPGGYTRVNTMKEAAELAIVRNSEELWSHSNTPKSFRIDAKGLRRACAKEDKVDEEEGIFVFSVVSPDGAIGALYRDDNDEFTLLDWLYFTRHRSWKEMPETIDELSD